MSLTSDSYMEMRIKSNCSPFKHSSLVQRFNCWSSIHCLLSSHLPTFLKYQHVAVSFSGKFFPWLKTIVIWLIPDDAHVSWSHRGCKSILPESCSPPSNSSWPIPSICASSCILSASSLHLSFYSKISGNIYYRR